MKIDIPDIGEVEGIIKNENLSHRDILSFEVFAIMTITI